MNEADAAPSPGARPSHGSTTGNQPPAVAQPPGARAGSPNRSDRSTGDAEDARAEQVLSQALRLMAGGGKPPPGSDTSEGGDQPAQRRFSTGQLMLLAITVGLLIGILAGFISLL